MTAKYFFITLYYNKEEEIIQYFIFVLNHRILRSQNLQKRIWSVWGKLKKMTNLDYNMGIFDITFRQFRNLYIFAVAAVGENVDENVTWQNFSWKTSKAHGDEKITNFALFFHFKAIPIQIIIV